jgi:hypothetical protein
MHHLQPEREQFNQGADLWTDEARLIIGIYPRYRLRTFRGMTKDGGVQFGWEPLERPDWRQAFRGSGCE